MENTILTEFNLAMQFLTQKGEVITSSVVNIDNNTEHYKVSVIIDDKKYEELGNDVMLATIKLRNQLN